MVWFLLCPPFFLSLPLSRYHAQIRCLNCSAWPCDLFAQFFSLSFRKIAIYEWIRHYLYRSVENMCELLRSYELIHSFTFALCLSPKLPHSSIHIQLSPRKHIPTHSHTRNIWSEFIKIPIFRSKNLYCSYWAYTFVRHKCPHEWILSNWTHTFFLLSSQPRDCSQPICVFIQTLCVFVYECLCLYFMHFNFSLRKIHFLTWDKNRNLAQTRMFFSLQILVLYQAELKKWEKL